MRLFLHMPKCAGTSIKRMLETEIIEQVAFDYDSYFKIPESERSEKIRQSLDSPIKCIGKEIVYGHFFPVKYIGNTKPANLRLVTILRDPIERLISHYNFWNSGIFSDHYLWAKMKRENWKLKDFIMREEMRNFYSQYLTQIPLQFFSYIGIYENLTESVEMCLSTLGLKLRNTIPPHLNKTEFNQKSELTNDFIEEAKKFHFHDYVIYDYALSNYHAHTIQRLNLN